MEEKDQKFEFDSVSARRQGLIRLAGPFASPFRLNSDTEIAEFSQGKADWPIL